MTMFLGTWIMDTCIEIAKNYKNKAETERHLPQKNAQILRNDDSSLVLSDGVYCVDVIVKGFSREGEMSGYLIQTHTTDTYKIENSKIVFTVTSPVVFSGNMEGIKYPKHITTNKEYRQLMEKLSDENSSDELSIDVEDCIIPESQMRELEGHKDKKNIVQSPIKTPSTLNYPPLEISQGYGVYSASAETEDLDDDDEEENVDMEISEKDKDNLDTESDDCLIVPPYTVSQICLESGSDDDVIIPDSPHSIYAITKNSENNDNEDEIIDEGDETIIDSDYEAVERENNMEKEKDKHELDVDIDIEKELEEKEKDKVVDDIEGEKENKDEIDDGDEIGDNSKIDEIEEDIEEDKGEDMTIDTTNNIEIIDDSQDLLESPIIQKEKKKKRKYNQTEKVNYDAWIQKLYLRICSPE